VAVSYQVSGYDAIRLNQFILDVFFTHTTVLAGGVCIWVSGLCRVSE